MRILSIFITLTFIFSCNIADTGQDDTTTEVIDDNGTGDNGTGDNGTGDNGTGDNGTGDNGTGDNGTGDNGTGDNGTGDNGTGDNGTGDNGTGDNGSGDNGTGDNGTGDNGTSSGVVNSNIKPNHKSEAALIQDVKDYYDYYKTTHMRASNGNVPGGYYLLADSSAYVPPDWVAAGQVPKTNSEAFGYAMIIAAFMENKEHVDGLYQYFHLFKSTCTNNDIFMSWIIPESEDVQYRNNSATDGDLDIAYALLIAHDKWGSAGAINYYNEAVRIIEAAERVLIADNNAIRFGDWCASSSNNDYLNGTRSSDWLVDHFDLFFKVTGNRVWLDVINTIYDTIIPNVAHSSTGLVPDFITGDLQVPTGTILEDENDKNYDWNACRYPWRQTVAFSQVSNNDVRNKIKGNMLKIANFADGKIGASNNFTNIKSSYTLDGTTSIYGASNAFIAPMVCSFTVDSKYQEELNAGWDYIKAQRPSYYHASITMLSMIYISGIWQQPLSGRINALEGGGSTGGTVTTPRELISNGDFSNGNTSWHDWYGNVDQNGNKLDTANYSTTYAVGELEVEITDCGEEEWSVGVSQGGLSFVKGKSYTVTLDIYSTTARDIYVKANEYGGSYTTYGSSYLSIPGDSTYHTYSFNFTMTNDSDSSTDFGIMLGAMTAPKVHSSGIVKFDNISIIEE